MASRSQMRLQQLTGSAVDIKSEVAKYIVPSQASALTGSDLQDVLGAMAAAIQRIHGESGNEVFNQDEGEFSPSKFDVDTTGNIDLDGAALNIGTAAAVPVNFDASSFDLDASAAIEMDAGSASHLKTSAGAITFDGAAGIDLQYGAASKLEVAAAEVTLKTDLIPSAQNSHDLGSAALAYAQVHAHAYYGTGSFASAAVADLADNEIVIAGVSGELEGDSNFRFDGSELDIGPAGSEVFKVTVSNGNTFIQGAIDADSTADIADTLTLSKPSGTGLDVTANASIGGNLTVTGDLTISGTTTTLDTANLLVEDPLIVLAKNQANASAGYDLGIIMERGSDDSYGMIWDESASEFAFINAGTEDGSTAGPVSISEYADLQARTGSFHGLEVVTMAVSDLDANRLVLSDTGGELVTNANFTYSADDLMVGGAGAVVLSTIDDSVEADIFKIVDSDAQIQISAKYGGNALHISDVSDAIALNAGNGFIGFENGSTLELGLDMASASNTAMFIFNDNTDALAFISDDGSGNQSLRVQAALPLEFRDADASIYSSVAGQLDIDALTEVQIAALTIDMNGDAYISGDLHLDGSNKELRFYEGANYVGFEAPALSADQIWVLPEADASVADSALVSDAAGNLSWKAPAQASSKKYIIEDGAVVANTSLTTTVNLSAITLARAVHVLDVYVNGQLMKPDLSGGAFAAYAGNVASTADYKLDMSTDTASEIKFGFALEADDVVTVIMRA